MNAERDELIRLVRAIPDDRVSQILAEMRTQLHPVQPIGQPGQPAWWLSYQSTRDEPSYWT